MLVAPVTNPPVPVADGIRETVICYARSHLSLHAHYPPGMCGERIWHFASSALLTCMFEVMPHRPQAGRDEGDWVVDLFRIASRQLRGYLYETIWLSYALSLLIERKTTAPVPVRKRWFELLLVHCHRQGGLARAAPVEPAVQKTLGRFADDRIREYSVMILRGKFGNLIEGQAG